MFSHQNRTSLILICSNENPLDYSKSYSRISLHYPITQNLYLTIFASCHWKRVFRGSDAMSKQVTVKYNEEYTGHYSKNGGNTALRQKLKASSQIQSAKKKLEFDEMTRVLKEQMKHM